MGVVARVRRLLRANLHEAIDRAEDPAKMVNYLILEMQESLEQARTETAAAMAAEKRLAQQLAEADSAAMQWEERARFAIARGNDDLAREALRRRATALALADQFNTAHREQLQAVTQLRTTLDRLQQRLYEAKARRSALLAQLSVGKAQQVVARSMQQALGHESFDTFDRIAGQIATNRQQALAITELTQDEVDDAFVIADEAERVEASLQQMKAEAGCLEPPVEHRALEG